MNTVSHQIADKFCIILTELLGADKIAEVNRRNALPEYLNCGASHDFCDANEPMAEAFKQVVGKELLLPCDAKDDQTEMIESECAIINAAWGIAKARKFTV